MTGKELADLLCSFDDNLDELGDMVRDMDERQDEGADISDFELAQADEKEAIIREQLQELERVRRELEQQ